MGPAITISGRYEILSAIPKAGGRSYHARHKALGTPLMVHFLAKGNGRQSVALLERLPLLPDSDRVLFIDAAEHDSVPYLVTHPLPGFDNLTDWVEREIARGSAAAPDQPHPEPNPVPAPPKPAEPPLPPDPVTPPPSSATAEFQHLFGIAAASAGEPKRSEPGEFTKAFNSADSPVAQPIAKAAPGEFTQLFSTPAAPAPRPSPLPQPGTRATPNEPGELTKLFNGTPGAAPVSRPADPAPATPPAQPQSPGEFTRLFSGAKTPAAPPAQAAPAPVPAPAVAVPGYTQVIQTQPVPRVPSPQPQVPGVQMPQLPQIPRKPVDVTLLLRAAVGLLVVLALAIIVFFAMRSR